MKKSASATLRKRLLHEYDFGDDPAALELVDQLVLAVEQLHVVQDVLGKDGLVTRGSVGQRRAHPLLAEQDRLRRTVLALCRSLRLTLDEALDA